MKYHFYLCLNPKCLVTFAEAFPKRCPECGNIVIIEEWW